MNISASDNIVQISGLNSAEFLQGQITNDINLVSDNAMLDSAICSVKGRVIAVFRILKACLLYTSPSPRDATLSRMPSSA